ncbi:hypothetical protein A1O7_07098 [Cladophialophora yegresii CBS 114405]|uniref:Uncharacterized protein n=1 Tax=Cladophialophora yegresii CBS 114405 TaxID=1182544 RepID=W9WDZ9_9EURO|nr:uncharacterized protein A1O7_07098 [Cladophialophora yegresii CBS 114405]EXJ56754.1 hypothetical protein A1O7_07098 [Cladophialophora yegresii CBS 114405]
MSSCGAFYDKLNTCGDASNTLAGISCYCPQTVLDILAGCRQEWWNCWRTTAVDQLFLGSEGLFAAWSTACGDADAWDVLNYSPTTMSITTPLLVEQTFCDDIARDCNRLTVSTSSCESDFSVTTGAGFQSCMCNADMLYLASRCDIDGSISCLLQTPVSTMLYSYMTCRNVQAVTTGVRTSSPTSSTATVTSTYSPAAPSPTSTGATAVPSASSEGGGVSLAEGNPAELALMVAIAVLAI